jgi:hypothetical protein
LEIFDLGADGLEPLLELGRVVKQLAGGGRIPLCGRCGDEDGDPRSTPATEFGPRAGSAIRSTAMFLNPTETRNAEPFRFTRVRVSAIRTPPRAT